MNQFSIVIPVHNKEKYIERTLNSVLNQTYPHFELILVNDGSVDNSGIICDKYAMNDTRIKVIHQKNGGVSNARNTGIKEASNNLIGFIDADDWWDLEFLEQMNVMIEKHSGVDIYSSKFATIQRGEIISGEIYFPVDNRFIIFDLIERCAEKGRFPINASSVIIRKKSIEKAGYFDERISMYEDYDLFVRIALTSKVAYLNTKPLAFYNLDVPAESKARGIVPKIEKHWISYFDKFNDEARTNTKLKLLLDRAILTQLIGRRIQPGYQNEVKQFISRVDKKNFLFKYKLIYYTPPFVGNLIIKLSNKL